MENSDIDTLQRRLVAAHEMNKSTNKMYMEQKSRADVLQGQLDKGREVLHGKLKELAERVREMGKENNELNDALESATQESRCQCGTGWKDGYPCPLCHGSKALGVAFDTLMAHNRLRQDRIDWLEEELAAMRQDYDIVKKHLDDSENIRHAEKKILVGEIEAHTATKESLQDAMQHLAASERDLQNVKAVLDKIRGTIFSPRGIFPTATENLMMVDAIRKLTSL